MTKVVKSWGKYITSNKTIRIERKTVDHRSEKLELRFPHDYLAAIANTYISPYPAIRGKIDS